MGDVFPKVKVAAVHAASPFLDRDAGVEKTCRIAKLFAQFGKFETIENTILSNEVNVVSSVAADELHKLGHCDFLPVILEVIFVVGIAIAVISHFN